MRKADITVEETLDLAENKGRRMKVVRQREVVYASQST